MSMEQSEIKAALQRPHVQRDAPRTRTRHRHRRPAKSREQPGSAMYERERKVEPPQRVALRKQAGGRHACSSSIHVPHTCRSPGNPAFTITYLVAAPGGPVAARALIARVLGDLAAHGAPVQLLVVLARDCRLCLLLGREAHERKAARAVRHAVLGHEDLHRRRCAGAAVSAGRRRARPHTQVSQRKSRTARRQHPQTTIATPHARPRSCRTG